MSTDPPAPAGVSDQPRSIAEVSRLANLLAERMLSDHMADRPVPDEHFRVLARASHLLVEYGQEVPPLLAPIMDQLRTGEAGEPTRVSLPTVEETDPAGARAAAPGAE